MTGASKSLDVVVAGDLFIDLIMSGFDSWPQPGTEAFAGALHREVGGGAAISACGLARLGSRTAVLGIVGEDGGDWVAGRLSRCGVVTSRLEFDPAEPTAMTVAVSTPGERTFLTYHGPNRQFPDMLARLSSSDDLTDVQHFHLAAAPDLDTAADLFAAIRRQNCTISLDMGWHEDWLGDARSLALLPLIDIFFPNEMEARRMTGEDDPDRMLRALASAGARGAALKLGSKGAALLWGGEILYGKPHPVKAVDTTGAGDCFNAGFLHFWLSGAPPLVCLQAASFCGAASTEAAGGIAGFPDMDRVRRELNNSYA